MRVVGGPTFCVCLVCVHAVRVVDGVAHDLRVESTSLKRRREAFSFSNWLVLIPSIVKMLSRI